MTAYSISQILSLSPFMSLWTSGLFVSGFLMVLASRFLLAYSIPFLSPRKPNTNRIARVVVIMPLSATTRNISTAGAANTPEQSNSNTASPSDVIKCGSSSQKAGKTEEKREVKILMLHGKNEGQYQFCLTWQQQLPPPSSLPTSLEILEFI